MAGTFYSSAEIRWFFRDSSNRLEQLLHWFTRGEQIAIKEEDSYERETARASDTPPFVKREEERKDEYLLFPDCDTVGVKQRQGKLEVKALIMPPRPYARDDIKMVGRIDQWVKWSFKSARATELEVELDQAGPWLRVVKNRDLQKISFDSGSPVTVSPEAWPDHGCNVELTRLEVGPDGDRWLTLGFEAFGLSAQTVRILDETVAHFFGERGAPPFALEGRDSLSYPAWLAYCLNGEQR